MLRELVFNLSQQYSFLPKFATTGEVYYFILLVYWNLVGLFFTQRWALIKPYSHHRLVILMLMIGIIPAILWGML